MPQSGLSSFLMEKFTNGLFKEKAHIANENVVHRGPSVDVIISSITSIIIVVHESKSGDLVNEDTSVQANARVDLQIC